MCYKEKEIKVKKLGTKKTSELFCAQFLCLHNKEERGKVKWKI